MSGLSIAEQLFSEVLDVTKVPVHFFLNIFRRGKQGKSLEYVTTNLISAAFYFSFSVFGVTFRLTTVS